VTDRPILAIDTSSMTASVAVYAGQVLAETSWHSGRRHSSELLPVVEETLRRSGMEKSGLTAIAVAAGPGSYSGLRVGVSTGIAMALALELAVVQVPTLEVIAWSLRAACPPETRRIRAAIDVGRGRFASARFAVRDSVEQETEIESGALAQLVELAVNEGSLLSVDLEPWVRLDVARQAGDRLNLAGPAATARRAGFLAELGAIRMDRGELAHEGAVEPIYLNS
jgi:tRNA threonylcarbamoyladenosine biosynthesis protein TsaB